MPLEAADAERLVELCGSSDHQGVVAATAPYPYVDLAQLFAGQHVQGAPLVFALDSITDPHNLGAIARVCDAIGGSGLIVPKHRSATVTAAACKASAGALEHVRLALVTNLSDALDKVRSMDSNIWVYGASERASRTWDQIDFSGPTVFVMGADGAGLRPRVESACDDLVGLPMQGTVASLNVSTVAAVLGYEAVRQRRIT